MKILIQLREIIIRVGQFIHSSHSKLGNKFSKKLYRELTNSKSAKDFEHIDYLKWNHKTDKLLIGGRSSVKNNMMLSVFDLSKNAYLTQKPLTTNIKDAQSTNVSFQKYH